ncbi:response regulator transcription factor [bacterium]|nr:response regulator transcription factor [bacterium]
MKILLLEDDILLNEIMEEHLQNKGYEVISAYSGDEAQELIYSQKFDLFLFDVNVPVVNGFDLLKNARKNDIKTPAIFLTSLNMVDDIEKGFDSGCDDYVKKPVELKELDIRINNIKRLFNILPDEIIKISPNIYLDRLNLFIKKDKKEIHLAKKECEILLYLINNNKTVSIEELSTNVWSYEDSPNASTVRTYIKNLRKILGEEFISNTRGVGYRFNK